MNKLAMTSLLLSGLLLSACANSTALAEAKQPEITVNMINNEGAAIGTARLTQSGDTVHLSIEARNLTPGIHAIHFHETGRCDTPDFKTAGAHLNPQHKEHGFHNPKGFHSGDLPNIEVGTYGTVKASLSTKTVTLVKDQPNSLLKSGGTSIIIHAKADDYITDPSGNSGDRIACGTVQEQ
ncbi:superoxide dismutase family protein [Paenibacillus sp. UMB4589-SE434]|uniref:superoxide dismutase family protein n=1 Tax=Paenibacillus sp. UMB4589-SE434 TaxID=3046314 RepID=UPI00254ED421|nr:superoxide dismutase family protein [Paenibacillus sp. UMB4589-SE434]MDK8182608.1 superoxide dismutase family protein [Paenibacillus sp. UMB4589-SE434]